jgi:hypothetical protein
MFTERKQGAVTSTQSDSPTTERGVYGLRIEAPGLGHVIDGALLVSARAAWPTWRIGYEALDGAAGATPVIESWSTDHARLATLPRGFITLDRLEGRTTLHLPEAPNAATILHPYLASTGVVAGHWLGRAPFHAGAFIHGGRAWGVLGAREMGKTSLLMGLHRSGIPVMADDLLVVEGSTAYSGPRCLDLRHSAAERFEAGEYLGEVGGRERWRVALPPVPPDVPFGGWVLLDWTDDLEVHRAPPSTAIQALLANSGLTVPGVPTQGLLDLLAFPMVRFGRPRDWARADDSMAELLAAIGGLDPDDGRQSEATAARP